MCDKKKKTPLDPILFFLEILGNLPLTRDEDGYLYFKLFSFSVVRSVITTAVKVYLAIKIAVWKISHSKYWESYDKTLNSINDLFLLDTCFHPLLCTWEATPDIARAVHRWTNFDGILKKHTNHLSSPGVLTYSNFGIVFITVYTIVIAGHYYFLHWNQSFHWFRTLKFVLTSLCLLYYFLILLLWIILCLMTKAPACLLGGKLKQALYQSSDPEVICNIRQLWVELLACTRDLVSAFGSSIQLWMLTNFMISLLSSYGLLIHLLVDSSEDIYYAPQGLITTTLATLVVFNVGHLAELSVSDHPLRILFDYRWGKLSKVSRIELELFLDTIEAGRQSYMIKGLFTINRMAFLSLWQTGLTYLVVLMQLKVSATKK